jgi:hypothetical protein
MKAINNPLRPSLRDLRKVRGRAVLKTIDRKRMRAAERQLFFREQMPAATEALAERRRTQALHQRAARDVKKLIADALATDKLRIVEAHRDTCAPIDIEADVDGRQLISQSVVLRYAGRRRQPSVVCALASCAID